MTEKDAILVVSVFYQVVQLH